MRLAREHARAFRRAVGAVAGEERYLAIVRPFPLPQVKTFVAECVRKKRPTFVAVAEERLVGGCDAAEKPRPLLAHSGVLGMGVVATHRGRGIGAALMDRTLADAKAKGFTRIELTVRADNERAKRRYEKFGFVVEGRYRRHWRRNDGSIWDALSMGLVLDEEAPGMPDLSG